MARRIKFKLIKSSTAKNSRAFNLKSDKDEWTGTMMYSPSVDRSFCFFRDDDEYMHTSRVQNIKYEGNKLTIITMNSEYELVIGEEIEPK